MMLRYNPLAKEGGPWCAKLNLEFLGGVDAFFFGNGEHLFLAFARLDFRDLLLGCCAVPLSSSSVKVFF